MASPSTPSATQPQTPAQDGPHLRRCNATLASYFVDDAADVSSSSASAADEEEAEARRLEESFNHERPLEPPIRVISLDSDDDDTEATRGSKRASPEAAAPARMLLDEEVLGVADSEPEAPAAARPEAIADEEASHRNLYARWVWTWYPEESDYRPAALPDNVAYMIYQEEKCPKTGKLHLQGYLRLVKRSRFTALKKALNELMPNIHIAAARGTEEECRNYCTKEATRIKAGKELGEYVPTMAQGHRSDLDSVIESCKAGKPLNAIAAESPHQWIKYHKGIESLHQVLARDQKYKTVWRPEITISVLWGPTNTGKTHRVLTSHPEAYIVKPGRDPWGQYKGQDVIVFDEFNPDL